MCAAGVRGTPYPSADMSVGAGVGERLGALVTRVGARVHALVGARDKNELGVRVGALVVSVSGAFVGSTDIGASDSVRVGAMLGRSADLLLGACRRQAG